MTASPDSSTLRASRWEYGSQVHLARVDPARPVQERPWGSTHLLLGCARDALRLLAPGIGRLWMPSYICQEVVGAALAAGLEVCCYPDSPLDAWPDLAALPLRPRDAVYLVNYFGLRCQRPIALGPEVILIEDHTHDPCSSWASGSSADFCLASFRKLYPLPDGAVLWSPQQHALPVQPRVSRELDGASADRLRGMELKARYLRGAQVRKQAFRDILDRGEAQFCQGSPSGQTDYSRSLLASFPLQAWRQDRRARYQRLAAHLPAEPGFRVLPPEADSLAPFSGLVVFDSEQRAARVKDGLIARGIYPSRLWPLDVPLLPGVPEIHRELSRRAFSVHLDMRYSLDDVDRVVRAFSEVWSSIRTAGDPRRESAQK